MREGNLSPLILGGAWNPHFTLQASRLCGGYLASLRLNFVQCIEETNKSYHGVRFENENIIKNFVLSQIHTKVQ